jgi:hypothetical protein
MPIDRPSWLGFIYWRSAEGWRASASCKSACCVIARPQVAQVKNPPLDSKPVSLHWGQAGVPSTQEGRVVVGIADIQSTAETAASLAERDGRLLAARNGESSRMNEDENESGIKKLAHCTDLKRFVKTFSQQASVQAGDSPDRWRREEDLRKCRVS